MRERALHQSGVLGSKRHFAMTRMLCWCRHCRTASKLPRHSKRLRQALGRPHQPRCSRQRPVASRQTRSHARTRRCAHTRPRLPQRPLHSLSHRGCHPARARSGHSRAAPAPWHRPAGVRARARRTGQQTTLTSWLWTTWLQARRRRACRRRAAQARHASVPLARAGGACKAWERRVVMLLVHAQLVTL
jgi:hypothetical protein